MGKAEQADHTRLIQVGMAGSHSWNACSVQKAMRTHAC